MASWLRKLLGSRDPATISAELQIYTRNESYREPKSAKLLKRVTKLKEAASLDHAIQTLREAYRQIEREGGGHTIQTYLRLPMLLQKAGRADEAWAEYNLLLSSDPTGLGPSKDLAPMLRSQVYDKMRLFLQREGRGKQAVGFGLMSSVCWATGLYYQKRRPELNEMLKHENLENAIRPLLRKAKQPDASPAIIQILRNALQDVPDVDLQSLVNAVHRKFTDRSDKTARA